VATSAATAATRAGLGPQREMVVLTKEQEAAAKKAAKAAKDFADESAAFGRESAGLSIFNLERFFGKFDTTLVNTSLLITRSTEDTGKMRAAAQQWATTNGAVLAPSIEAVSSQLEDEATPATRSWGVAMKEALGRIPSLVQQAFTGGGGLSGAMKSVVSSFGEAGLGKLFAEGGALSKSISGGMTKMFGSTVGGALSAALPGVGAALGSLIGPLFSKLGKVFGVGINAEVKKANTEIEALRQQLLKTHGPMDQLEAKANALGLSFRENWGHQGQAGLAAFAALMKDFEARLAATNVRFGELFTKATDLGIALPATLQASIQHLIDIGVVTGDVALQFSSLAGQSGVDFQKMQAAAQKYGVDLNGLGTQFQSARLHASALEIINDFELLTMGGADVGGVLSGMKDEINALVNDSIKFGTEIPENMRPWIAELIRTGQLTDANGEKITDLEGMKFGAQVATEFEKITTALQDVVASLGSIAAGINGIPSSKTFTVQAQYYDPGPPDGFGDPGRLGAIPMADGGYGRVSKPTLFLAGEAGAEDVAFSGAGRRFGDGASAPSGGGMDTSVLARKLDDLQRALVTTIPALVETASRHGAQTAGRSR